MNLKIYVNLLEEGTPTCRPTEAIDLGNGLYQLAPTSDYDPEDEVWEFEPGTIVRIRKTLSDKGKPLLLAVRRPLSRTEILTDHPNAHIVKMHVMAKGKKKVTEAVDLNNQFYKLLPTADYDLEKEPWEFSPGSVVRVIKEKDDQGNDILLAFDQIREDRMEEEYATLVRK